MITNKRIKEFPQVDNITEADALLSERGGSYVRVNLTTLQKEVKGATFAHFEKEVGAVVKLQQAIERIGFEELLRILQAAAGSAAVGDYKYSARASDHAGWLICDGRSLSKNDHPLLFDVIRYTFGGSAASFNLPDTRGRFLMNASAVHTMGKQLGSEQVRLTTQQLPPHTHRINDPGHQHQKERGEGVVFWGKYKNSSGWFVTSSGHSTNDEWRFIHFPNRRTWPQANAETIDMLRKTDTSRTRITIENTGQGQPVPIIPPAVVAGNFFIFGGIPS